MLRAARSALDFAIALAASAVTLALVAVLLGAWLAPERLTELWVVEAVTHGAVTGGPTLAGLILLRAFVDLLSRAE